MLKLRDLAGWLATTGGEGTWSMREREERTRAVVRSLAENLTEREVREMYDLIDHGEFGVAYEMLCTQLYEHEWAVTAPGLAVLKELGDQCGLRPIQLTS